MTYAFDPTLADDVSLVRFHIGDTNPAGCYLQDETIQYWIDQTDSIGKASLQCIQYIITQLSTPGFNLDWLSVNMADARKGYQDLMTQKMIEFGLPAARMVASVSLPHRADSYERSQDGTYPETYGQ